MTRILSMALFTGAAAACAADKPHVVYFMADDLGWADVGYHDGTIKTPNIDKLAAGGVKLEQFYVQPVCSPTRSSLMTGRYPIRMGLQVGVIRPWADYGLPLEERMLSTALKEAGYTTAISGKWHLGLHDPAFLPTRRGFDHQYGHYCGALDYFTHKRDGGHDWHRDDKACYDEGYTTQLIGREAVRLIKEHDAEKPLFLYIPFNSPHSPLQAPEKYLEMYSGVPNRKRKIFSAMVTCMDQVIGEVVAALDEKGIREDTLIVFHSDNGGPLNLGADNGPLRGGKGSLYEGGVRVPALVNWPGELEAGSTVDGLIHVTDMYPTLLTLAGAKKEQPLPLDGSNVWPMIANGGPSPRKEILHNVTPNAAAVRVGDWKLIRNRNGTELFHIAEDPFEKNDLSAANTEKLRELRGVLKRYVAEAVEPNTSPDKGDFRVPAVWGEPSE